MNLADNRNLERRVGQLEEQANLHRQQMAVVLKHLNVTLEEVPEVPATPSYLRCVADPTSCTIEYYHYKK